MSRLANSGLKAVWDGVPSQVRSVVVPAVGALVVLLLVVFTVLPSLKVLRFAAADHQTLDGQLETMRALAGQAQAIKNEPRPSQAEAVKFLETSIKQRLTPGAQMNVTGDRATLTLNNVKPEALAAWLADARTNGRLLPTEAKLARSTEAGWSGQLVLNLPAAR